MTKSIFVSLISLIIFNNVSATQETILTVSQPISAENGITESISTYSVFLNYSITTKMLLTCAENCVISNGKPRNRNLANILGFNITFSRNWDGYINIGDTIKVDLVIPDKIDLENKVLNDVTIDKAIKSTIICLFNNATSYNSITYLDLKIIGISEYKKYSKIYNKENIFLFRDL